MELKLKTFAALFVFILVLLPTSSSGIPTSVSKPDFYSSVGPNQNQFMLRAEKFAKRTEEKQAPQRT